jgi:hypothetical protein
MTMDIKFNQTIEVQLTPEQKDIIAIQLLQEIYRDAHKDVKTIESDPDNGVFSHPDDQKNAKRRLKAARRLLWYYMVAHDHDDFIVAVENGTSYTFNIDDYR